ncbi:MAG: 30S ribosomal protein S6 [Candidatus Cloacimonetes bacterium]|nr:30S ribosomal protein S6 [Candidatus Cloacimonadota bacterium]
MNKYESMFIIIPTLTVEEAKEENRRLLSFVEKNGGEIVETDEWGKRNLAYEIKKMKEGHYFVNYYSLDPGLIKDFEKGLRIDEKLIRYNILVKE